MRSCWWLLEGIGDGPRLPGHFQSSSRTLLLLSKPWIRVTMSSALWIHPVCMQQSKKRLVLYVSLRRPLRDEEWRTHGWKGIYIESYLGVYLVLLVVGTLDGPLLFVKFHDRPWCTKDERFAGDEEISNIPTGVFTWNVYQLHFQVIGTLYVCICKAVKINTQSSQSNYA